MILGTHAIGVCSWSFRPKSVADIVAGTRSLGLDHLQLALSPFFSLNDKDRLKEFDLLRSSGVTITAGMISFPDEDYSSISSIRKSGGFVPDELWPARRKMCAGASEFAADLKIKMITTHIGFVPEKSNPKYATMIERTRDIAAVYARAGIDLVLETGQETARDLLQFLNDVSRQNVFVNFDPANMILYGAGDPLDAIHLLAERIRHVHVKDAVASSRPGIEWGDEVVFGVGQVHPTAFIRALHDVGYAGPLVIERESGANHSADVTEAINVLRTVIEG